MVDGFDALRRWFTSPRCLLCAGASRELLCDGCRQDLPWNRPACPGCALPLATPPERLCAACARHAPPFDRAMSAFRYEPPIAQAVQRLKYGADFLAARWLGATLAQYVTERGGALPQALLPVPLHRGRLRRRGYNQALELARVAARALQLDLLPQAAERVRATEDQIGKSAAERRRNLRKAFAVQAEVRGLHLAIVDDVVTTGSTAAELARACRKAGAVRVEVWSVARAD
jgi:ComF family protein